MTEVANKLTELTKDKFTVALNLRLQAFYNDGYIMLNVNNQSIKVDPKKHGNMDILLRHIKKGCLNIVNDEGTIIYSAVMPPTTKTSATSDKSLAVIKTVDPTSSVAEITDLEADKLKKMLKLSSANVIKNLKKLNEVYMVEWLIKYENSAKQPRKGVLFEAQRHLETLKQKANKIR